MYKNVQNSILGDGQATIVHMVIAWDYVHFSEKNFFDPQNFFQKNSSIGQIFLKNWFLNKFGLLVVIFAKGDVEIAYIRVFSLPECFSSRFRSSGVVFGVENWPYPSIFTGFLQKC